jgi:hypothetical protein
MLFQSRLTLLPLAQDDDKRTLGDETGLNATQINNCASHRLRASVNARQRLTLLGATTGFINQRKRHWHKVRRIVCVHAASHADAMLPLP